MTIGRINKPIIGISITAEIVYVGLSANPVVKQ